MDTTARLKIIAFSGNEFADYNADDMDEESVAVDAQRHAEALAAERGYYKVIDIWSDAVATEKARGHFPSTDFEWVEGDEAMGFADEIARRVFDC